MKSSKEVRLSIELDQEEIKRLRDLLIIFNVFSERALRADEGVCLGLSIKKSNDFANNLFRLTE